MGPLVHCQEHLARLRTGILPNHSVFRHEVDESSTATVTDTEDTLQQRHATAAFANHYLDGRFVEVVTHFMLRAGLGITRRRWLEIYEFLCILWRARPNRGHHAANLLVADICSLATNNCACAW